MSLESRDSSSPLPTTPHMAARNGAGPFESNRPVVVHLKPDYLPTTETFVYETVSRVRRFEPVVLAEQLLNLERFPVPRLVEVRTRGNHFLQRAMTRLGREVSGMPTAQAYHYMRAVRRIRPALMHAHFGVTGYFASAIRSRLGIPLVTTFYGYDVSMGEREPQWQARYHDLFSRGDLFLVEGPHMRERLIAAGCPREKVEIQPVGIDLARFSFRARHAGQQEPVMLLHSGRMVEKKGHEYSIRALADCMQAFPGLRLRFVGDGPRRPLLQRLAAELDVSDSVDFLGMLDSSRYLEELDRAHLALQPSLTASDGDSEGGAPTTLLEAAASGLPIVASRHADIPFVMGDEPGGFLVPERDAKAFSSALHRMLAARDSWAEFGKKGRLAVQANHDVDRTIPALEARYERLLSKCPTRTEGRAN